MLAGVLARCLVCSGHRHISATVVWFINHRHISTIIVCIGSSTVPATGSFGWQGNINNRVIFIGVLAQILIFICRRISTAVVLFVSYGRLGTHITT